MNKEELLAKIRNARIQLDNAKKELNVARSIMTECVTVDNKCFDYDVFDNINYRLNGHINKINNSIIPKITSM